MAMPLLCGPSPCAPKRATIAPCTGQSKVADDAATRTSSGLLVPVSCARGAATRTDPLVAVLCATGVGDRRVVVARLFCLPLASFLGDAPALLAAAARGTASCGGIRT